MSIVVKKDDEDLPSNYVRVSRSEAINYQLKLISEWKERSDVWPYRYGPGALSITAAVTGGLIASFIRLKLKLEHFGRIGMLLPTMGIPAAFVPFINLKLVGEPLLIQSECPVCLQMRSMLIQNVCAVGYPIVMASGTGFFVAEQYGTYRLPEFSMRAIPKFINLAKNLLIPYKNNILVLLLLNTLVAAFITDRQANSLFTVTRKIEEEEQSKN